jgi:CheY-like chemotaxis protein
MTVLFIDDDPDDTELFCEAIEYLNSTSIKTGRTEQINCVTANNGCQGVELLNRLDGLPTYIFLDVNMPIMGGKECLKHLKSNSTFTHIPVIMLSTTLRMSDIEEFKLLGATDCIVKPSGFDALVKSLSNFLYDSKKQQTVQ